MGFFGALFGTSKLNEDPKQQALAKELLNCVENNRGFATNKLFELLHANGWSRSEQGNRLIHAASMTKIWRADLFPDVKKLAQSLYVSL